ncbi:3-hydroxyacyl-CoA dehydrogenase [Salinibacterium sp. NG22]|uniref:3-hydroxyacyl-CoA dehydrogenase n=1 Tax=Salinibacterium sp. NG22 TaxID=2792040 RepID=UPI0018CDF560|nr:3-hydroxyacyl-CoA dehydrogenase [Salinibacterium sp. NG22]MBH0110748.1 3-hydroxyacyl-CoA dehydrogenase [Salinibacterium sp. NG22]
MKIQDAAALITGGASGLGLATAHALAAQGAKVTIADLPSSRGIEIAAEYGFLFAPTDVRSEVDVEAAVALASSTAPLRIVVNCAGVATPGKTLGRKGVLPLDTFETVIGINLTGTFNVIRLAAAAMVETDPIDGERGVIVNTASVAAFDGQIGQPAYAASKAGVAGMTLPLAREFASALVRVMTIAPGIFETPMMAGLPQEAQDSLGAQVPHPSRLGRPDEYASLVQHIVENPMLNGEVIRLDGAIRMQPR